MTKLNFLILIVLLFSACDNLNENSVQSDQLWGLEDEIIENGQQVAVDYINESIEKANSMRLTWAYSPITIALKIAGQQMISPEVKVVAKSLSGNELITHVVVMTEKKAIPDDSMRDEYYRIELKLGGSIWMVSDIKQAWNCREGSGSQQPNAELCK